MRESKATYFVDFVSKEYNNVANMVYLTHHACQPTQAEQGSSLPGVKALLSAMVVADSAYCFSLKLAPTISDRSLRSTQRRPKDGRLQRPVQLVSECVSFTDMYVKYTRS